MHGGDYVAEVLKAQGIPFLFTLCGGHIAPILVGCKQRGIRVIDTRHEATAVFAADAVARLTGRPGIAAVTAGPGLTNTLTALKNAQMAQSPVILIGGAAPTALQGRGALQDIDQLSFIRPQVKLALRLRRVGEIMASLERAFQVAQEGVPGPVFLELAIDLLYDEALVRKWYGADRGGKTLADKVVRTYLGYHVNQMFAKATTQKPAPLIQPASLVPDGRQVQRAAEKLLSAKHPVILIGSQTLLSVDKIPALIAAIEKIGAPVYLSGMARGLLGRDHPLQMRHKRREALREADCVLLAGVPADFRLDYGNHIRRSAVYLSVNRSRADLTKNRRPTLGILADPALTLIALADHLTADSTRWSDWTTTLHARDGDRTAEIEAQSKEPTGKVNPIDLCREIDRVLNPETILIGDGGDFVATASYTIQPTGPLRWLDPGVFGTLGVGAGFALGAKLVHPEADVIVLFGDGSVGYSLSEFDTFVRHNLPIFAVVGNDAAWSQIAREQIELLHDDVGTVLTHTDYDRVVEAFGGCGRRVEASGQVPEALRQALEAVRGGKPALVNVILGKTDFRKGSISM